MASLVFPHALPASTPRALLFDLDGVLLDSMRYHARAWQSAVRAVLGESVVREEIYRREGEPGRVTARDLLRLHHRQPTSSTVRELLRRKEEIFMRARAHIHLYASVRPLLMLLRRRGVPLALVTGTSHTEVERILPVGVRRHFRVVVTGDQVRHGKPHPEPYVVACRRLRQSPRHVAVVENAPFGIASAHAAGVGWVIGLATSLPAVHLRQADVVLSSLSVLRPYVRRLLRQPGGHIDKAGGV